ncbi:adaptor protein MecA [Lachnobacterium bovis]|uniref:Adapter protein MecA 1/2 n=1 Tax=Lachnobacterium bovis DSM 14045 TaxID=1122142 RepID=A0A1H3M370_9FIRM|nr:adaptor protein MecA [Lachnobacterium bovis]SDY71033.1 adapter protein MecA 1/2 [Lachnobacterium bovis DSM 14045]
MKIERVNENQIRCTLTKEDLENRQIKLSELAYGTEKARDLFRDMMQQANSEFGFEANNGIPLMVEAVPLSGGNIILMITKVEYPEELDTRFSKFTEIEDFDVFGAAEKMEAKSQGVDDILDIFKKMHDEEKDEKKDEEINIKEINLDDDMFEEDDESSEDYKSDYDKLSEVLDQVFFDKKDDLENTENKVIDIENYKDKESDKLVDLVRMYEFNELDIVMRLSKVLKEFYNGENSLYKNINTGKYYLVFHKNGYTPKEYNKICNVISEYGKLKIYSKTAEAYLREHAKTIVEKNAIEVLAEFV